MEEKERGDKQGGNGEREMAEREKRIKGTMERERNKTRRDRGREGDRKDKGKQEGTGGGGVRDRRRERENVRGLKRREGGKRWKMEQWEKLLLIFCL